MRAFLTLADSKEALPDSSGHLLVPGEVSAFVCLLTTIALPTLENLYHSIPLYMGNSNAPCPDPVRPLVQCVAILGYFSSPGKCLQSVTYCVLQACGCFRAYTIRFPSVSGLQ